MPVPSTPIARDETDNLPSRRSLQRAPARPEAQAQVGQPVVGVDGLEALAIQPAQRPCIAPRRSNDLDPGHVAISPQRHGATESFSVSLRLRGFCEHKGRELHGSRPSMYLTLSDRATFASILPTCRSAASACW